eukprot:21824-Prorocentrum_minimum.AAC.1
MNKPSSYYYYAPSRADIQSSACVASPAGSQSRRHLVRDAREPWQLGSCVNVKSDLTAVTFGHFHRGCGRKCPSGPRWYRGST